MTALRKVQFVLLASVIGFAAVFVSLGLLAMTSPVLAQEPGRTGPKGIEPIRAQPPTDPDFDLVAVVVFTDPAAIDVTDLAGNVVGQGVHEGKVSCHGDNCSQKTSLAFNIPVADPVWYEYRFKDRLSVDRDAGRVVVAGVGTIHSSDQKERFTFTATFEKNGDGSVKVTYAASRPDASFVVPQAHASFVISSRR